MNNIMKVKQLWTEYVHMFSMISFKMPVVGREKKPPKFYIIVINICFYIYIYAFSRRFYPKRLTIAFRLYIFIIMFVPWESNPQPTTSGWEGPRAMFSGMPDHPPLNVILRDP